MFVVVVVYSRAHTIVGITLVQKFVNAAGEETTKSSVINLVDLAGRSVYRRTTQILTYVTFYSNLLHKFILCKNTYTKSPQVKWYVYSFAKLLMV